MERSVTHSVSHALGVDRVHSCVGGARKHRETSRTNRYVGPLWSWKWALLYRC
jgi:hypothetical protein